MYGIKVLIQCCVLLVQFLLVENSFIVSANIDWSPFSDSHKPLAIIRWLRYILYPKERHSLGAHLGTSSVQFSLVSQSCLTLRHHVPLHTRPPCPSPTPGVHPNPCPLCRWCHPTISSSVVPFSSCPQSCTASGSFQMSQLFTSGGQSIGVSASTSVPPMNAWDRPPLGWTGCVRGSTLIETAHPGQAP